MKIILLSMLVLVSCINPVHAGGKHKTEITNIYETYNAYHSYNVKGVSAAMAGDAIDFTRDTSKWQVGVGISEFSGSEALAIGISKRFNETTINLKLMTEDGDEGYSLGGVWAF